MAPVIKIPAILTEAQTFVAYINKSEIVPKCGIV